MIKKISSKKVTQSEMTVLIYKYFSIFETVFKL